MSQPYQFTDSGDGSGGGGARRDPSEILDWMRTAEIVNPQGQVMRPGKILIVRPLEAVPDRRAAVGEEWKKLVYVDVAVLDALEPTQDQYYQPVPAVAPGTIFRNQLVFPGKLITAWKGQIGNILIGVIFLGPASKITAGPNAGQMGKPPFMWRSLTGLEQVVARGQSFLAARPQFLTPVPRQDFQPAQQHNQDPWAQPAAAVPMHVQAQQWGQQHPEASQYANPYATTSPHAPAVYGGPQYQQTPPPPPAPPAEPWAHLGPPPQYQQQPVQTAPAPQNPPAAYQGDPWAQQNQYAAGGAMPAQQAAQSSPNLYQQPNASAHAHPAASSPSGQANPMSTLEQLKAAAAANNHQGQPQPDSPPF